MMRFNLLPLMLVLTACSHDSPTAIAEQAKNIGVYAQTASGLVELLTYGVEGETDYHFADPIPQMAAPSAFIVNVPNANIAETKVYLLKDAKNTSFFRNDSDPKPIPSGTQVVSGTIYKITPSQLPTDATGFLCLKLSMPMGTRDRMYAIEIKR